jgi:TonB family protein
MAWQSGMGIFLAAVSSLAQTNAPPKEPKASAASAIQEAIQRASENAFLTDPIGVDYLDRVLHDVQEQWCKLIPAGAGPPENKKGKVVLEFAILKDGSVAGLKVVGSSGDLALDRPAYGSITGSNPFPPLPRKFPGPYLLLRLTYYYNLDSDDGNQHLAAASCNKPVILGFGMSTIGPVKVPAGSTLRFSTDAGEGKDAAVTWSLVGDACAKSDCGRISQSGLYTAPAKLPEPTDFMVTATQTSAPFKSVSVPITIIARNPDKQSSP